MNYNYTRPHASHTLDRSVALALPSYGSPIRWNRNPELQQTQFIILFKKVMK